MNVNERSSSPNSITQPVHPPTTPPIDDDLNPEQASSRVLVDGQPNWHAFEDDVPCPLCDYNMRGLPSPRCPECGGQYSWPDLLDPVFGRHPFLFEHQRQRTWWSFWRTLTAGLIPRFFWKSVKPTHQVEPKRLYFYLMLFSGLALVIQSVNAFVFPYTDFWADELAIQLDWQQRIRRAWWWSYNESYRFGDDYANESALGAIALVLVAIVSTFLSLKIFHQSLRKAKIKKEHVLRCVIYSTDLILWMTVQGAVVCFFNFGYGLWVRARLRIDIDYVFTGIAIASLLFLLLLSLNEKRRLMDGRPLRRSYLLSWGVLVCTIPILLEYLLPFPAYGMFNADTIFFRPYVCLVFWLLFCTRLVVALRSYIQMQHAFWVVVASQAIVALVIANVYSVFYMG